MSDLFGGWVQESDYTQSQRIRELTDDLGSVRSSLHRASQTASALRNDLAALRGSLDARLTRLSEAFTAFVELSSLRDQLSLVAGPALVRQATRARLVTLGTARADGPVLDVAGSPASPGYWLADALAALGTDDTDAAERAAVIDRRRTATFLTIAGAVTGLPDLVRRWAPDALGDLTPTEPVTRAQRALWLAAAHGLLGDDARAVLLERLRAAVAALPSATADETVTAWGEQVKASASHGGTGPRTSEAAARARRSAATLQALRALVETPADPGDDVPVFGTPDGETAAEDRAAVRTAALDELAAVLRALVDEGAEEERELMTRVAELEAVVAGREAPGATWHAPAGALLDLLRDDALTRRDPAGVLAREATAPWLRRVADAALADGDVPVPTHVDAQALGLTLRARPGEAVEGLGAALERARTPQYVPAAWETPLTVGLAVAAGVLLLAAVVDGSDMQWVYGLAAVAAGIAAVTRFVQGRGKAAQEATRATRAVEFVEREAKALQERTTQAVQAVESARSDAQEAHARVVAGLDEPSPTTPDAVLTDA
ncbi:methyltransferase type 11 [Cellulomonas flavigena DSM 20109]|uniref:Methyltransferase type 11 n=1 Tax=Cellulomonas flavigena (strain ATCC 482 / DSM 20109 / BCRC 11376 / JCM 18109 / NBRC 3775 / NCIMB 8073 / NRS 134) TaxID=446466 RepID=D5UJD3_CELFN|nr:hypothetical protein [Cellulomonas flavigena]ADG73656.1 methyltransferase type 11 [Cellulomonas flavigena DSM 20109]